jgi:hypothetical protein
MLNMKIHKPSASMKIMTKCERIQPTCTGLNEKGELVWEGRTMAFWQMVMFRVQYIGDFINSWMTRSMRDKTGLSMEDDNGNPIMHSSDVTRESHTEYKTKRKVWGD